jgi:hypothetical protein
VGERFIFLNSHISSLTRFDAPHVRGAVQSKTQVTIPCASKTESIKQMCNEVER